MFESLKKRRRGIYRAVPVPSGLLDELDMVHGIREAQDRGGHSDRPFWPWARITAWRHVTAVMAEAGIPDGAHRSPKGLRHGYGIHAIRAAYRSTCSRSGWGTPSLRSRQSGTYCVVNG